MAGHPYEQGFDLRLVPSMLPQPLRWRAPRRIFVNSMSDLFQAGVPDAFIGTIFNVMADCHTFGRGHTFQVLTKRAERMQHWCQRAPSMPWFHNSIDVGRASNRTSPWPLPNVWLGVSVEDQQRADARIPLLLDTPAAVRFVSVEPLLGPVDLSYILNGRCREGRPGLFTGCMTWTAGLDLVIIGGESGPRARPCNLDWIRSVVRQCRSAGVLCFVKQLGTQPVVTEGAPAREYPGLRIDDCGGVHLRSRKGADPAEWPEDLRIRELPQ